MKMEASRRKHQFAAAGLNEPDALRAFADSRILKPEEKAILFFCLPAASPSAMGVGMSIVTTLGYASWRESPSVR